MNINYPGPEFKYHSFIEKKHLDFIGHVNNAKYLEIYEDARWDIISSYGFDRNNPSSSDIVPIVTEIKVRFRKELHKGDEFEVYTKLQKKKSSLIMTMDQKILKIDGRLSSDAVFELGMFNLETRRLCPPSERFLKAMGVLKH